MDAILSIATRVGECLVVPIGSQASYFVEYHKNVVNLQEQVNKLNDMRDDVQRSVNAALRNGGQIKITVTKWLTDVEHIIAEAQLLHDESNFHNRCWKRWFPILLRYKLSKEAFKKTSIAIELQSRKPIDDVSITLPPLNIEFLPDRRKVEDVMLYSETQKNNVTVGAGTSTVDKKVSWQKKTVDEIIAKQRDAVKQIIFQQIGAVDQIFDALQDDNCETIEIYGMGGIGKTTLAKEIGKMAKNSGLFDEVVLSVVSQNQDIRKIQGQIGDILGVWFLEESEMGRAGRLYERLTTQERILLILDDVWHSVNLTAIGIPHNTEGKGCKILITSRQKNICSIMGFQRTKEIPLRFLSDEESLDLLKNNAGLMNDSFAPQLDVLTTEVAKQCAGLPLAVVTVGRALRDKDLEEWKAALQQLKKSKPLNISDVEKDVFSCLKLSFDNLKSEEAKECFLMCCLFPEDHDIKIEDIARYGMGKGLFTDIDTMEEARRQVRWIMRNLKDSCLLLDSSKEDCVRMHDMVRDFAILLASEKNYGFLVKAGLGLKEWPNRETLQQEAIISVMANQIQSLPEGLNCPRLEILLLGENEGFELIPDKFFKGMKLLSVLDLSERIGIRFLNQCFRSVPVTPELPNCLRIPSSFEALVNLRTLYLDHCKLNDVAVLGMLTKLEILSFYGCDIKELPIEMGQLVNLRLLDLNFCQNLKTVPTNLISRFIRLEELYMGESFREWGAAEEMLEDENKPCLSELTSLAHLTTLCVQIASPESVPRGLNMPKLQKFEIAIGHGYYNMTCYPNSKCLYLQEIKTSIPEGVNDILVNTEELKILCLYDEMVKSILDVDQGGLNSLKSLKVTACVEIFFLMDTPARDAPIIFPALEKLHLGLLDNMEYICRWSLPPGSLQRLKILKVVSCHRLQTTVTAPLLQRLLSLEEVEVERCNEVTTIFELHGIVVEKENLLLSNLREISLMFLPKLHSIWSGLDPHSLSVSLNNLRVVELWECRYLRSIFPSSIAQTMLQLEVLKLKWCFKLESIVAKGPESVSSDQNEPVYFQKLKIVEVSECRKLKSLFSIAEARNLLQLEVIKVSSCNFLVELISLAEKGEKENEEKIIFLPKLNSIEIKDMPGMKRLCAKPFSVDLPSLEEMVLVKCPNVEEFTSDASKYGLESAPKLKRVQIEEHTFFGAAVEQISCQQRTRKINKEDEPQELKPLLKHTD